MQLPCIRVPPVLAALLMAPALRPRSFGRSGALHPIARHCSPWGRTPQNVVFCSARPGPLPRSSCYALPGTKRTVCTIRVRRGDPPAFLSQLPDQPTEAPARAAAKMPPILSAQAATPQGLARQYRAMKYFVKVEAAGAVLRNLDKITCRGVPRSWGLSSPALRARAGQTITTTSAAAINHPPAPPISAGSANLAENLRPGWGLTISQPCATM